MKVLILGSTGLIGHQIHNYLDGLNIYNLYNIANKRKLNKNTINIDARIESDLFSAIKRIEPNIIINCIGVLISESKQNPINAISLNAYLPNALFKLCEKLNSKLIHISTDCVFSGEKQAPYVENDYKDGFSLYAKTKGLGEIIEQNHLTIRTSVVGPELKPDGEELFHWFMQQSGEIKGYKKSVWSGVTTIELAKAVDFFIKNNINGLYHLTNNDHITKYELLKLFKRYINKNVKIIAVDGAVTNKSFKDTRLLIDYEIPSYEKMIEEMTKQILEDKEMYKQYHI
jgi:dTDP-4-dehydrorhamnose reductase